MFGIIVYSLVFLVGACLGSFTSVLITRIPKGEPWTGTARSACPVCGHSLAWYDLVPFVSWLSAGGRCRYCQARVSVFYPALEATAALLACLGLWILSFSAFFFLWLLFLPFFLFLMFLMLFMSK